MAGCHGWKAEAVLERVLSGVARFSLGAPQADDITVLALRYHGERRVTDTRSASSRSTASSGITEAVDGVDVHASSR